LSVTPIKNRGRAFRCNLLQKSKRIFTAITNAKPELTMNNLINISKAIAIISFIIGTILFVLQLYNSDTSSLIYPGILFIIIALIINFISIIGLVYYLLGDTNEKSELLKTIGMVLLNLPIAILYFYILIHTL
jgi:hypothetical protein